MGKLLGGLNQRIVLPDTLGPAGHHFAGSLSHLFTPWLAMVTFVIRIPAPGAIETDSPVCREASPACLGALLRASRWVVLSGVLPTLGCTPLRPCAVSFALPGVGVVRLCANARRSAEQHIPPGAANFREFHTSRHFGE